MYTNNQTEERKISRELNYALVIGLPLASGYTAPNDGDHVKLNTDGTISPVSATTDKAIGHIASAYTKTSGSDVRVHTGWQALTRGECDGTLTPGDEVACSGIDASGTYNTAPINKYKTAGTGDYVVGICLVGGLTTTTAAQIALYQRPYLKP